MDEQLLRDFLAGAEEAVEALFGDLKLLRERRADGRARRALVARVFRNVHTIKGTASAAGLAGVGRLAHEFETLLDAVRAGRVPVEAEVLDASEDAVEALASLIAVAADGRASEPPPPKLVERLRHLSSGGAAATPGAQVDAHDDDELPEDAWLTLGEHERRRLREAVAEGARVYAVTVDFDLLSFDERFRQLSEALSEAGEVVASQPGLAPGDAGGVNFRIVYASAEAREKLVARLAPFGATILAGRDAPAAPEDARDGATEFAPGAAANSGDAPGPSPDASDDATPAALSRLTMLVRVPLEELDDLISDTHELFTDASGALDLALESLPAGEARAELEARAPRVRRSFVRVEERLIGMRMALALPTLERAARAGASAARAAGREVEFATSGGDVRLDRSLAESVSDALLHLVRNAVHHGIEPEDERRAAGKPSRGRVRLEAKSSGGRVLLRVSDDGRGVDVERVERAALRRGIIEAGASLDERQALRLIFRPGFSTSAEPTEASGRGVGLDVVERAVEAAGGELRVWSRAGAGTTFELRLPTTLALIRALVVRAGEHSYCLDVGHVSDSGTVPLAQVRDGEGEGRRLVGWRGRELPFVSLRELLGAPHTPADEPAADERVAVVISHVAARETEERAADETRVAVAVDELEGRGEVLVRGLGRHAAHWRGVSGATERHDGTIALLLDLPRLLEMREAETGRLPP